ncbi:MAG: deaminase [Nocardioidaceae bacterium]|nr:deaminase [Nocardioidaceae bacterium]
MTKVQYYVASSVDGFIATVDDRLDWLLQFGFDDFGAMYDAFLADVGSLVMGSTTYEWLLREVGDDWPYASLPCFVATNRALAPHPAGDIDFVQGDIAAIHQRAAAAADARNVWVVGGGDVAAQFANEGLLDDLILTIMPVVLGEGRPLLPLSRPTGKLSVRDVRSFASGAMTATYSLR